jgi:hypothetical protein
MAVTLGGYRFWYIMSRLEKVLDWVESFVCTREFTLPRAFIFR